MSNASAEMNVRRPPAVHRPPDVAAPSHKGRWSRPSRSPYPWRVPARRRTDPVEGRAALAAWAAGGEVPRSSVRTAVRFTLEQLADLAPGNAVEVRVPPDGAVQAVAGPRHTRGTPPNVVETDPETWLALVTGRTTWSQALATPRLRASGERADLSGLLPLDLSDDHLVD